MPAVDPSSWSLRIHGMVDQEVTLTWDELLALPLEESVTTLACVSNEVGGGLIGNAVWLGYPIRELLARAAPTADADMVLSRSVDGFTASTPLAVLEDDRNAILAVGMNGDPLPPEHGFPVRMVVPGLYGYVSATKWVVDLEVTRFDAASAYWTDRGWSERGPIKISSRIDVPRSGQTLSAGPITVAGVAWHQHVGIEAVDVQVDDGPWRPATLATAISIDTWVQWRYDWDAPSGTHTLRVRATGADGEVQTSDVQGVVPDGATGLDERTVDVDLTGAFPAPRSHVAPAVATPTDSSSTAARTPSVLNQAVTTRSTACPADLECEGVPLRKSAVLRYFGTSVLRYFATENCERNTSASASATTRAPTISRGARMVDRPIKVDEQTDRLVTDLAYFLRSSKKSIVRRRRGRVRRDAPPTFPGRVGAALTRVGRGGGGRARERGAGSPQEAVRGSGRQRGESRAQRDRRRGAAQRAGGCRSSWLTERGRDVRDARPARSARASAAGAAATVRGARRHERAGARPTDEHGASG